MYTPGGIKDICAGEISKVDRTVDLEPYVPVENQDGGGEGVSTNLPSLVDRLIGMVQDVYTAQGGVAGAYNPQYSPGCVLCVCRCDIRHGVYIYTYIYTHLCVCIYIYVYVYIYIYIQSLKTRICLSLPTKGPFSTKAPTNEQKRLLFTRI